MLGTCDDIDDVLSAWELESIDSSRQYQASDLEPSAAVDQSIELLDTHWD
ncbi:MAG: hypothetical protein AAFX06_14315 [Planctomycetota bacterium]